MSKAIVRRETLGHVPNSLAEVHDVAGIAFKSGMFKDVKAAAQAAVKIMRGAELGLGPMESMTSIHVVEGKPTISAQLMGALAQRAGYRYRVEESTDQQCTLRWFAPDGMDLGPSSFSMEDARRAGLVNRQNWRKYPRAMLRARALSEGARLFAAGALLGVYTEDEIAPVTIETRRTPTAPSRITPTPQPTIEPTDTTSSPDPDIHPGEGWKSANAAARSNMHAQGISEDERKMLIQHYWSRESFTELRASHLKKLADAFNHPPTETDKLRLTQAMAIIEQAGGRDKLDADGQAQMLDLCESPWQVVLLYRALAGGAG